MCENTVLLEAIKDYIELNTSFDVTVSRLQHYLTGLTASDPVKYAFKVPSSFVIRQILREKMFLKYGRMNTANLKYKDPTYNEKRLWIARLLAQFLFEDTVIISVDESHFRSDTLPGMQWQFTESLVGSKRKRECQPENQMKKQRLMTADPFIPDIGDAMLKFEGRMSDSDSEYSDMYDDEDRAFEICEMQVPE